MINCRILCVVALLCASAGRAAEPVFVKPFKAFAEEHCITCHGPDSQKGGLRLDTLSTDLTDERTATAWINVHDKIRTGEMPPKKRERPTAAELASLKPLEEDLYKASRDRQKSQGRVEVRRLNGTEYENTLRDLLGTRISVKEMLPEDNSAAGFDNVSSVLDISATHQLLYQEAAEKAVLSTIPVHPPIPFSDTRTGKEMSEKGSNFRQTLGRSCRVDGDSLLFYSKLPRYGLCSSASVPAAGRYKATISIAALGVANKSVPAAFAIIGQGREDAVLQEMRDIAPGKSQQIVVEVDLKRGQAFVVNLMIHWDIRAFKKALEEHTGPGLRVDWIRIEAITEPFPPLADQKLFAGVPLKARSVAKAESEGKPAPKISPTRPEQQWQNDPLVPASAEPKKDAERLIRSFLPRAFRRPVSDDLAKQFVARVHARLDNGYTFADAMLYGYKAILTSPHFLLLLDQPAGKTVSVQLDDYALASRLAYFLWSMPPDAELLAVAAKGELSKPDVIRAQTERLLKSPKAKSFTDNFTGQWLDLRKIDSTIPDPQLCGEFDGTLLYAMPRETTHFFDEVLANDRSLLEFIDSDWTMLNERLARHYGIPGVEGNHFRKVMLPANSHRGGVITQAAVLKVTADGTRTSPVLRGKWVLEKIIGRPPSPPPPDVPAIEPDIRGATTIRQQLDKHRNIAACASCHVHIDPPGFALENFDPIGTWREFYRATARTKAGVVSLPGYTGRAFFRGPDVELGGETPEGIKFTTIEDYKKLLLSNKDQLSRSLTEKVMIYATGADIEFADREVVEQIVEKLKKNNYGFRTLVHEVVQSRVFREK